MKARPHHHRHRFAAPALPLVALALFASLGLSACMEAGLASAPLNQVGERGEGRFVYQCVNENDAMFPCEQQDYFPDTIALGSRLQLRYRPYASADAPAAELTLRSASPQKLEFIAPRQFIAHRSGYVAVLAVDSIEARDLLHLYIQPVERLAIRYVDVATDLDVIAMEPGQVRQVLAIPYAAKTQQIAAGSLEYNWSSSSDKILQLRSNPKQRRIEIIAHAEGTALLTVVQGAIERSIEVKVSSKKESTDKGSSKSGPMPEGKPGLVDTHPTTPSLHAAPGDHPL